MALLYVTKVHIKLGATWQDKKFNLVEARKNDIDNVQYGTKLLQNKIWDFYYHIDLRDN